MSILEILKKYDLFDGAILRHGFVPYMRDYEIQAHLGGGEEILRFLFRGVPEVHYQSALKPEAFSIDDRLIADDQDTAPDKFHWSVSQADVYPGWRYRDDSGTARRWSSELGIQMHEVTFETNVFALTIVFHDLAVSAISEVVVAERRSAS